MKTSNSSHDARTILATLLVIGSVTLAGFSLSLSTPLGAAPRTASPNKSTAAPLSFSSRRTLAAAATAAISPAPIDSSARIGFENFEAPGNLVIVKSSTQGSTVNTAEYLGHDAGEPSIGVNWNTNVSAFQADIQTCFVTFNDSCDLTGPKAAWRMSQPDTAVIADQDPIGFVDRVTGRTFSAQLTLATPTCKTSFTDSDGLPSMAQPTGWTPAQGFGVGSGIDHQTIGGGPYHAPLPSTQRAYYYCSQLPAAGCARSDDGGANFGPSIEIDPPADAHCAGIHGHVKVAPDGTVFVPTCNCDGFGSVIVSENNGITWTIRHVPNTASTLTLSSGTGNIIDAQIAIDDGGKLYFAMANAPGGIANGSNPIVATTTDNGVTWQNMWDLGATFGIQNIEFPYVAAADANRAAVAFLGTTVGGDPSTNGFNGIWHLYVAATFNGGASWTISDATPNDPLQRGCVWNKGGANICRNLLDFIGASVDKFGRIEVGYVDGCADGTCDQATQSNTHFIGNGYTARGVIARQSSGRRLVAAYDPASSTSVPGMPALNARRVNGVVHLSWSEADSGNLMINNYQVLRGTAPGNETPLVTLAGSQVGGSYNDTLAPNDTATYYYKVVAVNSAGSSCPNNELAVPWVGDTCNGIILQKNPADHSEQTTQGTTPSSLAIEYIALGEPPATSDLQFKMKVTDLSSIPANSRWRIVWDWEGATGQQYYVGMRSDSSSNLTFEYGHVATAVVGLVLGLPTETKEGDAIGTATPDGLITINVPKSAVGNPQVGDLLGAVNGRTFTGDTPETANVERSNLLMDHTFAKGQRDNGHPAATYMISGNNSCNTSTIGVIRAVSRKLHRSAVYDVDLPLTGPIGIEPRLGGSPSGNHTVVISFATPVTVASATCGGNPATTTSTGTQVAVNCSNIPNAQRISVNLLGVSDGTNTANVSIPMGVLLGDTNGDGSVNSADISQTKSQSGQPVSGTNFREDGNIDGSINSADISLVKSQSGTALP